MNIQRLQYENRRYYKVENEGIFPSVTTILRYTKDQTGLDNWKKKIGEEAAEKIEKDAANRGTVMHKLLELYFRNLHIESKEERLNFIIDLVKNDSEIVHIKPELKKIGTQLFYQIFNSEGYLENIKKVFLQESFLYMNKDKIQFAGTVDNASYFIDDKFKIIDFKTALKPKQEKYITDYKMQISAYAIAIWDRYDIKPDGAEIWIANELGSVQKFVLTFGDIREYFIEFKKRLKLFNELYPLININN